jgi:hypothetical protein
MASPEAWGLEQDVCKLVEHSIGPVLTLQRGYPSRFETGRLRAHIHTKK